MPDASPFNGAVDNRGLFSDYYLENVFGDRPDVADVFERADDAFERAQEIYDGEKQSLEDTKEGQTEKRFIRPLLEDVLGWDFIVQETVQGQKSFGEPDYALFSEAETYKRASEEASQGQRARVFRRATALAEAKKWHLSLDGKEDLTGASGAPSQGTPGAQLLRYFQWTEVSWGILTNGNKWRLYTSRVPSPVDTYLEFDLERILEQASGTSEPPVDTRNAFRLFYALLRAQSFQEDPTLGRPFIESVFEESVEQGEELEDELTERVFDEVFLKLATGLYEDWRDEAETGTPSEAVLEEIYEATLRLLYRLLFLLYAEERDLLPVRDRKGYHRFSLSRIAREAREEVHKDYVLVGDDLWEDLQRLFGIINAGEPDLNVPTYNGHLFDLETGDNAWLDHHTVPDKYLAPALTDLTLMDPDDPDSLGVDYKALDVRQLGSIYEGLLEHRLRHAEEDLGIVKKNGNEVYEPLSKADNPIEVVGQGALYLETDESKRKKTGSYYTPHYVVEYIVENTLGPILDERIEQFEDATDRIEEIAADRDPENPGVKAKLDKHRRRARDALLSLRVCDPAMGSGHFLVHAVDYVTNRIGSVVLERDLAVNPIREHLDEIRGQILDSLDEQGVELEDIQAQLDDFTLLKRLVMKQCIYGVDLNEMAVELAKLSLWLRSFTVGAPLSFLNHHLKQGNSLIGTTVDAVRGALEAEGQQFEVFGGPFAGLLQATELMQEVARLSDATVDEVRESARRFEDYKDAMGPYKRILDLWVSRHFGNERAEYLLRQFGTQVLDVFRGQSDPSDETQRETLERALDLSDSKNFFHWELEFPEVYYDLDRTTRKQNPGFDAVIGNPPYVPTEQIDDSEKPYITESFDLLYRKYDLSAAFMLRAENLRKENRGVVGMITPVTWQTGENYDCFRTELFTERAALLELVNLPFDVFPDAYVDTGIVLFGPRRSDTFSAKQYEKRATIPGAESMREGHSKIPYEFVEEEPGAKIFLKNATYRLRRRMRSGNTIALGDVTDSTQGIVESFHEYSSTREDASQLPYYDCDAYRYEINVSDEKYIFFEGEDQLRRYYTNPRILFRRLVNRQDRLMACHAVEPFVVKKDLNPFVLLDTCNLDLLYILANVNSRLHSHLYVTGSSLALKDDFRQTTLAELRALPIREIDFTTPEAEREQHVEALIGNYEAARSNDAVPSDTDVLAAVDDHLSATPERADVVHDLLAHLAREMTQLKHERRTLECAFDPFKYLPRDASALPFSDAFEDAIKYGELLTSPVDVTKAQHNVDDARLTKADGDWVLEVLLKMRDPDNWEDWQEDDGKIVREWVPALRMPTLDDEKARFYRYALPHLAAFSDNAFSGTIFPGGYTRTVKTRLWKTPVPVYDPSVDLDDLVDLDRELQAKEREIGFTDGLIDRVVYRLYGLSEEEVGVVEAE